MRNSTLMAAILLALPAMAAVPTVPAAESECVTPASVRKAPATRAGMAFNFTEADIIRETPAGQQMLYSKSADYYSMSIFGIGQGSSKGMPCTVVEADNGDFYIYNPYSALDSKSWLKAHIDGERMTVKLPQAIYSDSDGENDFVYVAQMCHFESTDPDQGEGLYYAEEGETEIVFNREGDTWVMQEQTRNDHPLIMGLVAADDGSWCAYSDWNMTFRPFNGETVSVPEGLATEQWAMTVPVNGEYAGGWFVNVGLDGSDIYIQGMSTSFPEAWIKGSVADGKAVFESRQYLGADEMTNTFGYFFGATTESKYNEEWDFWYDEVTLADNLTFDYDAEAKTLNTTNMVVINKGAEELNIVDNFNAPHLLFQGTVTDFTPANPVAGLYSAPGDWAGYEYFTFVTTNKEGQLLDTDHLYYRVYVDGELLTFYSDEYEGLPEDEMEEIPFSFSNFNNIGYYGTAGVTHFFYFTFSGFDTLDIQTLYRDGDNVYASDIVNVVGGIPDAVEAIGSDETPASVEWYDLQGRRVANPGAGLYLKRSVYADGDARTVKVIVK